MLYEVHDENVPIMCQLLKCIGTSSIFSTVFERETFFPGQCSHFKIKSTLKGKHVLVVEQILFFQT